MIFNIHIEDEAFVEKHIEVVKQKLTTCLILLVQELHEEERKYKSFIGKGISPDASFETARVEEERRKEHERLFGSDEQRRQQIQATRDAIALNTMVPKRSE
jgi:hypothetical protein